MAMSTELSSTANSLPISVSNSNSSAQFTYSNGSYFPLPFHPQQSNPMAIPHFPEPYIFPTPPVQIPVTAPAVKIPTPPVIAPVFPAPAPVSSVHSLPQYKQAQQLFQRDAQTITPEALESVKAALATSEMENKAETKKKAIPRKAAGQAWEDPTLADWSENDYRLFCGDLGNEVNDDVLSKAFSRFASFNMARAARKLQKNKQEKKKKEKTAIHQMPPLLSDHHRK
ncbi:hypothetical protein BVC80_1763g7 [Macleaya cordata]|uniref:RNA recognition motif domain n=1 Tax=Macleaya cordata TaxID=56857 RepID=A0A200QT50_MACCD|nr:hypothetical protein BVC80_1763g7 [Macleaya cordata]